MSIHVRAHVETRPFRPPTVPNPVVAPIAFPLPFAAKACGCGLSRECWEEGALLWSPLPPGCVVRGQGVHERIRERPGHCNVQHG